MLRVVDSEGGGFMTRTAWAVLAVTILAGIVLIPTASADRFMFEDARDVDEAHFDIAVVHQGHRRAGGEILLNHKLFTHAPWPGGRLPASAWVTFYFNPNADADFERVLVIRADGEGLRVTKRDGTRPAMTEAAYLGDSGLRLSFPWSFLRRREIRSYDWYVTLEESHVIESCPSPPPDSTPTPSPPSPSPTTTGSPSPTPCPHGHTYSNDRVPDVGSGTHVRRVRTR